MNDLCEVVWRLRYSHSRWNQEGCWISFLEFMTTYSSLKYYCVVLLYQEKNYHGFNANHKLKMLIIVVNVLVFHSFTMELTTISVTQSNDMNEWWILIYYLSYQLHRKLKFKSKHQGCYGHGFIATTAYAMRSREISLKSTMWHYQFSVWLKCSFGEVYSAENPTWIGPVVPKLCAIERFF